jgi:glucose/arabinose dehydrogenase
MFRPIVILMFVGFAAFGASAQDAITPPTADDFTLTLVADGFDRPLYVAGAGDDSGRLFVVSQFGTIHIVQDGQVLAAPFIDLTDRLTSRSNEQGLLGLAFHPDYEENGWFYVNYSARDDGDTIIARYSVSADDPNTADPDSEMVLLRIDQPYPNHNGGMMTFGSDGYLYIAAGDGGSQGDPQGNGQNTHALLAKILRIDVDGGEPYGIPADNPFADGVNGAPEVWHYGLRNPWRFSFDRETGDMYVADVGQNTYEEVNFVPAGVSGVNFGWNLYEGLHPYSGQPAPSDVVMPFAEYAHNEGQSVTGGYVYRGSLVPALQGIYLYADFASGRLWYAYRDAADTWQHDVLVPRTGQTISSFGEDDDGELYITSFNGGVYRFE